MDIAAIGRQHLADVLAGGMFHCDVDEWKDGEGKPVRIYWKPVTGVEQQEIDAASTEVGRTCMTVKVRALNADGSRIFKDVALEGMLNDYDYATIRAIAFVITGNIGQGADEELEETVKE